MLMKGQNRDFGRMARLVGSIVEFNLYKLNAIVVRLIPIVAFTADMLSLGNPPITAFIM